LANIISDIDQFIVDRLKLIKVNNTSLPVLPFEPSRDRGHTPYPCLSVSRVGFEKDRVRSRYGIEVSVPKTTKIVIPLKNGNVAVVPEGYEIRDYPGMYILRYIIDTEATVKEHADYLMIMMEQAFPYGYEPEISGQTVLFSFTKPLNKDDLKTPLFKTSYLFDVFPVAIEALEHYEVVPMSNLLFDQIPEEYVITDSGGYE
jgi:hypothetical protein